MLGVGLLCLVVNVVLVLWVLRGDPDELGKAPYGHAEAGAAAAGRGRRPRRPEPRSLSLREAMHTASFWLFTVAMFVCGAGDFLLTTHLVPMATDHGVPTSTAVAMLAWFGLLSLGGVLLAGPASDLIGDRVPIAVAFGLRVVLFLLVVRYQNAASFWVLALGFGFTFLVTAPLTTTLMGRMYGFASIGLLGGFITTVHHVGGGFWAYLGGVVYDATGSYALAMAISADRVRRGARVRAAHPRGAARGAGRAAEPGGRPRRPANPGFAGGVGPGGARVASRARGVCEGHTDRVPRYRGSGSP